tara:strand:+ start:398 stop:547 length:150 start_codon:yes stop_codon:yes gene_type:complete
MYVQFPPEADGKFDTVSDEQVASWQQKLNQRFGIGAGRLKVLDEPKAAS